MTPPLMSPSGALHEIQFDESTFFHISHSFQVNNIYE